nr:putative adhesion G protein-coupled receptor E4P [Pocillopora verrucosa]
MTAAMNPKPEKLRRDVILKFKNLQVVEEEKHCMFWSGLENSPDGFSEEGCRVDHSKSNSEETICSCNHLTQFAVLVDFIIIIIIIIIIHIIVFTLLPD